MGGLFEIGRGIKFQVAHMGEMNPALQGTDHVRQVVFQVGAVGAGTEGDAVVRVIHHFHHAKDVGLVDDDAGKSEHAPGGIVRMDRHVDVVFVADRHDALQEIFQIGKQRLIIHVAVHLEQLFDVLHAFRFPAGHDGTVGV